MCNYNVLVATLQLSLTLSLHAGESITVSEVYKKDFDRIQSRFARLFHSITKMIEEAQVTLEDLKKLLTFNDNLEALLQDAETITKVMRVVQQQSSFINCVYLEEIADHFKLPEAKKEIDSYELFVDEFCQHKLTQHSYAASLLADQSKYLLSSESITFKLQWNPVEKTLADIQGILRKTFPKLASRIHVKEIKHGCVRVVCYAPQYLMGALVRLAQENMKVLVESSVTYLSVGYAVVVGNNAQKVPICQTPLTLVTAIDFISDVIRGPDI